MSFDNAEFCKSKVFKKRSTKRTYNVFIASKQSFKTKIYFSYLCSMVEFKKFPSPFQSSHQTQKNIPTKIEYLKYSSCITRKKILSKLWKNELGKTQNNGKYFNQHRKDFSVQKKQATMIKFIMLFLFEYCLLLLNIRVMLVGLFFFCESVQVFFYCFMRLWIKF